LAKVTRSAARNSALSIAATMVVGGKTPGRNANYRRNKTASAFLGNLHSGVRAMWIDSRNVLRVKVSQANDCMNSDKMKYRSGKKSMKQITLGFFVRDSRFRQPHWNRMRTQKTTKPPKVAGKS